MRNIKPLVFSGPSGGGKSTLIKRLFENYPNAFAFSVSHTTRKPRPGEEHGREYYFATREDILDGVRRGEFLEYAEFSGNIYGTSKKAVDLVQKCGKICVLDVDLQGVRNVKKTNLNPTFIFIKPPSLQTLVHRLTARNTESEETLRRRIETAERDMKAVEAEPELFDHVIVNDDLDVAYEQLLQYIKEDIRAVQESI